MWYLLCMLLLSALLAELLAELDLGPAPFVSQVLPATIIRLLAGFKQGNSLLNYG